MHQRKTEGTVGVSDGEGKEVAPEENLGLYSGYAVGTQEESCAWIDLDHVKLAKMDADNKVEIVKEDKNLEIDVKSGSLLQDVLQCGRRDHLLRPYGFGRFERWPSALGHNR